MSAVTVETLGGVREWSLATRKVETVEVTGELAERIRHTLFSTPEPGDVTLTYTGYDLFNRNHTVEVRCGKRTTTLAYTDFNWLAAALHRQDNREGGPNRG